jgi:cytochrome c2
MSLLVKSILAVVFLGAGLAAAACMLTLMGKAERRLSAATLRRMHKGFGALFAILLLVISYFCLHYVRMGGDDLSARAVLHGVLALAVIAVLALKLSIVRFFREFLRFVPSMGMTVLVLSSLVFFTSAGYFFLGAGRSGASQSYRNSSVVDSSGDVQVGGDSTVVEPSKPSGEAETGEDSKVVEPSGDAEKGGALFDGNCSFCHYAEREESKLGPGLKGVLKRDVLPFSGKPATPENVREQLVAPSENMPSFGSTLSEEETDDLIAFLETL